MLVKKNILFFFRSNRALTRGAIFRSAYIYPMKDGHAIRARSSDFIIYSVEAEFIEKVVAEYGPCTS